MWHHLISATILIAAMTTCVRVGQMRGPQERAKFDKLAPPPLSSWSDRTIHIAMLGHRGLYDDFVSIWLIQSLADENLKNYASAEQANKIITSVTRLEPKLESIYLLSCLVMAFDYERPDLCEEISLHGLKAFPHSWRIPMTQGFVAAFKLQNPAKASGYYALASSRPQSPSWVQSYAKKLAQKGQDAGQDLNETVMLLKEVPGGTRLLELLRPRLREQIPVPIPSPSLLPSQTSGE